MRGSGLSKSKVMSMVSTVCFFDASSSFGGFRCHRALPVGIGAVAVDPLFDDVAEMPDQALHRPGGGIPERADGVALDLIGHVEQHVDLALLGATIRHPGEHPPHPAGA